MESKLFILSLLWALADSCTTPLGQSGDCISLYECPSLLSAFSNRPLSSRVTNFLQKSRCGFDDRIPKVCCGPLPDFNNEPNNEPSSRTSTTQVTSTELDPVDNDDSSPAPRNQCGMDTNGDRIYGGQATDIDEFPWMALLGYRTATGRITYQCGGVLINHRYVLTAAHCMIGSITQKVGKLVTVRLGEYNTQTDVDCKDDVCADPPQNILVEATYPHSGYTDSNINKKDDIGLVRLERRAKYTYYVQPLCLSSNGQIGDGIEMYVAGWGKTLDGKSSPVKLKLSLPTFNKNQCVQKYRGLGAELIENQICAGGTFSEDTCRGDSGGPLMRKLPDGIWESVGIVSFGYGCGRDGWPGVYTSVAAYNNWIRSKLSSTNV